MAINTIRSNIAQVGFPAERSRQADAGKSSASFKEHLQHSLAKADGVKFSGHAIDRLADRGVVLTEEKGERLLRAIEAAEAKGSKDSLVLLDELAFVVSVKNRTVITACETSSLKEGVFTKIDSAVLG
jgi:flagellar operon protein